MLFLPCPSSLFWPTQPPHLWKHKLGKSFYLKEKLSFTASLLIHIICSTVRQRCSSASDGIDWRVWMRPEINRKWFRLRSPEEFMKPHCKYNTNTSWEDLSCADFKDLKGALNGRDLCTPSGVSAGIWQLLSRKILNMTKGLVQQSTGGAVDEDSPTFVRATEHIRHQIHMAVLMP